MGKILNALANIIPKYFAPKYSVPAGLTFAIIIGTIRSKTQEFDRDYPFFPEGRKIVSRNAIVKDIVGEPIKFKSLKILDRLANRTAEDKANFTVQFKGPKSRGLAEIYGMKDSAEDKWVLRRVQVRLDNEHRQKKLILYKNETEQEAEVFKETI